MWRIVTPSVNELTDINIERGLSLKVTHCVRRSQWVNRYRYRKRLLVEATRCVKRSQWVSWYRYRKGLPLKKTHCVTWIHWVTWYRYQKGLSLELTRYVVRSQHSYPWEGGWGWGWVGMGVGVGVGGIAAKFCCNLMSGNNLLAGMRQNLKRFSSVTLTIKFEANSSRDFSESWKVNPSPAAAAGLAEPGSVT